MKKIDFSKVTLTGGFLHTKQELVKSTIRIVNSKRNFKKVLFDVGVPV